MRRQKQSTGHGPIGQESGDVEASKTTPENSHEGIVKIKPVAKGRPRFNAAGRAFTPEATRVYERELAWLLRMIAKRPLRGYVEVDLQFYTRSKADLDNLTKAFLDAANGILYQDDSQVSGISAVKVPSEAEEIRFKVTKVGA